MSKKLSWLLYNLPELIAGPCLIIMTTFATLNALARYAIGYTVPGLDDLTALLFCWSLFLGAAVACKRGKHFSVDLLVNQFPGGVRKCIQILIKMIEVIFMGALVYLAFQLTANVGDRKLTSLNIPYVYLDLGFLVGMVLIFVYTVMDFVGILKKPQDHKREAESE